MAEIIFPLIIRSPGILRDGSLFQGDFCTDGQWIRFYQGKPKKIEGQRAINIENQVWTLPNDMNCLSVTWADTNLIFILAGINGIHCNFTHVSEPDKFQERIWDHTIILNDNLDLLWQSTKVVIPNINENGEPLGPAQTAILLFGSYNLRNINNVTPGFFYKVLITQGRISSITKIENLFNVDAPDAPKDLANFNGGTCYVGNLLFIFGTQGSVAWSRREDPFRFSGGSSGRINISNDKVVYGVGVRGGSNPPTVLFWTINSVVKISNQSSESSVTAPPDFQVDIISNETSILSSRCVVEYDGMFFWLGVDRMFLYNGVVREVVNNTNFDWFFSQVDITRRQLAFGIKNSEKGEIWWYFCTKDNQSNNCNHALIYNFRENSWYDTKISRDCGVFEGSSGKMITYGKPLITMSDNNDIWIHEEGTDEILNDGTRIPILSSFTTPIISLPAFSPLGEGNSTDNLISIERIEPDFGLPVGGNMTMTINARYYADSNEVTNSDTYNLEKGIGKQDIRFQGRHISFTFSSENYFRFGNNLIVMQVGDKR